MDFCQCIDVFNVQLIIRQILDLLDSQVECTSSHCFNETPMESMRLNSTFGTIALAMAALGALLVVRPARLANNPSDVQSDSDNVTQMEKDKSHDDHNHDNDRGHGPGMSM